jgi:proteic killer suppression protein
VIRQFKHKGLKRLFESGDPKGINPQHVTRLRRILALLETAETLADMDLPSLHLHGLKGERKGTWAVRVSGNWRVTFKLKEGHAVDVNLEDYH